MLLVALALATTLPATNAEPDRKPMLDRMLADQDHAALARMLNSPSSPEALLQGLNWQRDTMFRGATIWVAIHYTIELWRLGELRKEDSLKQTAAFALLYVLSASSTDGKRCKDPSAPASRLDQIGAAGRPIVGYLRTLPEATRRSIVDTAIQLETRTSQSPDRARDWYLCSGGRAEIQYGLKHGATKPAPGAPSKPGGAATLDTQGYKPEFLPETTTAKAITDARAQLRTKLSDLVGL